MSVQDKITILILRINAVGRQSFVANLTEIILYNLVLMCIGFGYIHIWLVIFQC